MSVTCWRLAALILWSSVAACWAFVPPAHRAATTWKVPPPPRQRIARLARTLLYADPYTIQILMSDTGGGHRASANALRDALDVLYPNQFACDIVDLYTDYGPFWPYNDYVAIYKWMAKYPWTWDLLFQSSSTPLGIWLNELLLTTFCMPSFTKCLERPSAGDSDRRADMIVSVHPLCQEVPIKIRNELDRRDGRQTPFCTVVTDLGGAHPTWFNAGVDRCFVPSDVLNQQAQNRGLNPETQITQYGLPVRQGFWKSSKSAKGNDDTVLIDAVQKTALRRELGLDPELPTALVVGGGDGMGGIVDIAKALASKLEANPESPSQLVIVCGKNEQAKQELEALEWKDGVTVNVQGFVYNMDEWMKASDCLVTKAGPGTIAEASICGLPCMLFSYLPGQEEGNIPFVEESGFGSYSGDPAVIADTVASWLQSPETLVSMQKAALAAARPDATLDIARDLAQMAFATRDDGGSKAASSQTRVAEREKVLVRRK